TVNPGVSTATARAFGSGILHDIAGDIDVADLNKTISVRILFCGDGLINVPGETCDPPGSGTTNPPHLCRDDCTFCGDGILQANHGEECEGTSKAHCNPLTWLLRDDCV